MGKIINAGQKEEFDLVAERNPRIESAYQKLQVIRQDRKSGWNMRQGKKQSVTITNLLLKQNNEVRHMGKLLLLKSRKAVKFRNF